MLMKERREDVATVPARQPPGGGPKHVRVAALGIRQEAALTERIGQAEHAAAIDPDQIGELLQRHRLGRRRHGLEDG